MTFLSYFYWDPNPDIFTIPYFNHPLKWYGLLFMSGVVAGFLIMLPLLKQKLKPRDNLNEVCFKYLDGLLWWVVLGTIVGARLGHVFFYQWDYYQHHLSEIPKIWEGGLASHGGTLGVLLAIYFYSKWTRKSFPELNFLALADLMTIPTAFAVLFIRLGNFVNQEILGTQTTVPWAVIFGHPADGTLPTPRHPVQLYEALAYLFTFVLLLGLWKWRKTPWPQGFFLGLFLVCIFGSRFFLEYYKAPQNSILDESWLQAGQILSLPFIFFGAGLMIYSLLRSRHDKVH